MSEATQHTETVKDTRPDWQKDLDQAGFVRRLLLARRWFGADWWFAVFSGVLLLFIFSVGVFPGLYSKYDPREQVGQSLLPPGEQPQNFVLVAQQPDFTLDDLAGDDKFVGIVRGSPSADALRSSIELRQTEYDEAGQDIRLRPRISRFDTIPEALTALQAGEVTAIVAQSGELDPLLPDFPDVQVGGPVGELVDAFPLGTNQIGQDVLSRIIWGTRIALFVGFSAAVFALVFGVPLGLAAGFWSGRVEKVLTLVMDSLYSFPGLILAIAITSVLGPGVLNVIVAIAVLYIPTYYRIARGQTLQVKEELYVEAARSLGARSITILWKYILPNVIPSLVVIFSVNVADAILTEAGLSFLGLGLPPDTPDWGIDLAQGQDLLRQAWWLITFPGLMIVIVTLGFSMLGESLSEILNPRLSEN